MALQTRQDYNREIIKMLSFYVENFPDYRFGQILINSGAIERTEDPFYIESKDTYEKVSKGMIPSRK